MPQVKSYKKEKFQKKIQNELNSFLRNHVRNVLFRLVSITKVELSGDFSFGTIYWDTYDLSKKDEMINLFKKIPRAARTHLAKTLDFRYTPFIKFVFDDQFEAKEIISNILKKEEELGRYSY